MGTLLQAVRKETADAGIKQQMKKMWTGLYEC